LEAGAKGLGGAGAAQGWISLQEQHRTRMLPMRRGNTRVRAR